ncbi:MAG: hypothetical protein AAB456_00805 [Patescibacteria group bacterium]
MRKIWHKFHPLFGPDLKIGFETTFPREVILNLPPFYGKSGLVYDSAKESVKRIYEPAIKVLGSCLSDMAAQVFFKPVPSAGSLFHRLVFARKINHSTREPRQWMIAARHGEMSYFGFDSWNSWNERYLSLAYPGISKEFVPVYVKIQDKGGNGGFVYLEVWAWDEDSEGKKVAVQARRVTENEAPKSLLSVRPGLDSK